MKELNNGPCAGRHSPYYLQILPNVTLEKVVKAGALTCSRTSCIRVPRFLGTFSELS